MSGDGTAVGTAGCFLKPAALRTGAPGVGYADFTRLAAVRAIVQAIAAEPNLMLPRADATVAVTRTFLFAFVANRAKDNVH